MLNPINHALEPTAVDRYKVEPYVLAADVYSEPPHGGRGGWTWYTGSAAWLYRLVHETIFGIEPHVDTLRFRPRVPALWTEFNLHQAMFPSMCAPIVPAGWPFPGAQMRRSQIDQQDLGVLLNREGYRALIRDPNTVALGQDDIIESRLAAHGMEPGGSARRKLVDEVAPGIENGRADHNILVYSQGSFASIRGYHNA